MTEYRIVTAKYDPSGVSVTDPIYKGNYGNVLRLVDFPEGMIPDTFEMHFSVGGGNAKTQIGTNNEVLILDECLTKVVPITAWLFLHDAATDGETKHEIRIPVKPKDNVTDAEPTPVEQSVITQAIAALNSGVTRAETAADAAEEAQEGAEAAATRAEQAATAAQGAAESAAEDAVEAVEQVLEGYKQAAESAATRAENSATDANASRESADQSATNAGISERNARASAEAAAQSVTAASGHAQTASQKATQASNYADNASASARSAEGSAGTAEAKASEASASANTASQKAQEAAASAGNASRSASDAEAAKTGAETAETNAESAATAAAGSASAAQASAGNAAGSATAAAGSASAASGSATAAAQSASNAAATLNSAVQTINAEKATAIQAIQNKGDEVIDSIPADYSELTEDVNSLKSALNDLMDVSLTWTDGYYLASDGGTPNYADYQISNKYQLNPEIGLNYHVVVMLNSATYCIIWDANDNIIGRVKGSSGANAIVEFDTNDYTGAAYIRLSNKKTNTPSIVVNGLPDASIVSVPYSKIDNVMVEKAQAEFIQEVFGTNLFNKDATGITADSYINDYGVIVGNASYASVSDYTEVKPSTTYCHKYEGYMGDQSSQTNFYTKDKLLIKTEKGTVSGTLVLIATPANCKYIKFTYLNSNVNTTMLVEGSTYPGTYSAYEAPKYYLVGIEGSEELQAKQDNVLWEKTAIFDGDSICKGTINGTTPVETNGWAGYIGTENNMNWHNYGVSGGDITSASNPALTGDHSVVDNIDTMHTAYPDADYIIFEGGTNDADQLGNAISDPSVLGSYTALDFSGSYDITTFTGALETIFYKATQYWTGKKIGYIVAQKMGYSTTGFDKDHANRRAYFERAIEICNKWGIPYINLWDNCYLNPNNPACYDRTKTKDQNISGGYLYTDGQHLTEKGYDYICPIIEAWMRTL